LPLILGHKIGRKAALKMLVKLTTDCYYELQEKVFLVAAKILSNSILGQNFLFVIHYKNKVI
jgi:hypothetical protein